MTEHERLLPTEMAALRHLVDGAPDETCELFTRRVVGGLLREIDTLTAQIDLGPDDLDVFIRQEALRDPQFAREYMKLREKALVAAVRMRHLRVPGPDGKDVCDECSRVRGGPVLAPCRTVTDIGELEGDEADAVGSPRARAIRAMTRPTDLLDVHGWPIDLEKVYTDRTGTAWVCMGFLRLFGDDEEQALMSTFGEETYELTLRRLIEQRGPVTPVDLPPPDLREISPEAITRILGRELDEPNEATRAAAIRLHEAAQHPERAGG